MDDFRLPEREVVETWSPAQLAQWLDQLLQSRFGEELTPDLSRELQGNLRQHFIDGKLVVEGSVPPEVWVKIVPQHGFRLVILEEVSRLRPYPAEDEEDDADPSPLIGDLPPVLSGARASAGQFFEKSRFSNCPLLDNSFTEDPDRSAFGNLLLRTKWNLLKGLFYLRTAIALITWPDLCVIGLYIGVAYLCSERDFAINFSPTIFVTSIIFPLSFSVNSAFQRREKALQELGNFKAGTFNLYLLQKTWSIESKLQRYGDGVERDFRDLFGSMRLYLQSTNENEKEKHVVTIYRLLSSIHMFTEELRKAKKVEPPVLSRAIHDLRFIMESFERLRVVADYRTPSSIRVFTKVSIIGGAFTFGPYLSHLGTFSPWAIPNGSVAISGIFVCLQTVQRMLENPFISPGLSDQDDINLDYLRSIDAIAGNTAGVSRRGSLVHSLSDFRGRSRPGTATL